VSRRRIRRTITVVAGLAATAVLAGATTALASSTHATDTRRVNSTEHLEYQQIGTLRFKVPRSEGETTQLSLAEAAGPEQEIDCNVEAGWSYLRTSSGKGSVGFKPFITCTAKVDSLRLTGQMYFIRQEHPYPAGVPVTNSNVGESVLRNRLIAVPCNGSAWTTWFGRATATMVKNGQEDTGTFDTPHRPLQCGAP
jgi:hypothetical protein